MGGMATPAPTGTAAQKAAMREVERRRRAAAELRLAATMASYAAHQVGNGLTPDEARRELLVAAGELEAVAAAVRRAVRLRPVERRALAAQLHALGWNTAQIARQIGVSPRCVRYYVTGRACP
jgi:hypothetical protein